MEPALPILERYILLGICWLNHIGEIRVYTRFLAVLHVFKAYHLKMYYAVLTSSLPSNLQLTFRRILKQLVKRLYNARHKSPERRLTIWAKQ